MSDPTETNPPNPNPGNVDVLTPGDLDKYVYSAEFDIACSQKARERARAVADEESNLSDDPDYLCRWSEDDTASTAATDEDSSHEVSKLEAYFYYKGIAPRGHWPRLIYRDSEDIFEEPKGPDSRVRSMRLTYVPETHEFARDGLWERVRDWVAAFLIRKSVGVTSVDFVRFTWAKEEEDGEIESEEEEGAVEEEEEEKEEEEEEGDEDEDDEDFEATYASMALIKPVEDGNDHYSNPTIWIGILSDTLTSTHAHELTQEIRAFLNGLSVENVDIAFRESLAKSLVGNGPELYAPVESGDPLQDVIDNVSVTLSLPISGCKTTMQGTMGPYFHKDGKLFALTARHNLFLSNDGNREYRYKPSAPKKEVIIMRAPAFTNFLVSTQARIGHLNETVKSLKITITSLTDRVANGIGLPATQHRLEEHAAELTKTERKIVDLKKFYITMNRKWSKMSDRVIGHVVYAPPIGIGLNRFTRDFCVVELDKSKFTHFIGNVLSLGPEYKPEDLTALLYQRIDVPSEFKYPPNGHLKLRGMLTPKDINNPNTLDSMGDRIRRVLKRGFKTNTTVGTLSRFMSFVRHYFTNGSTMESLELPILPHESETGTFSKGGDSGAVIVSPSGEFVGLLTSGTNKGTDGSDITYATLFEYIWDLVLEQYPGANLYWEDIQAFLAATA